MTPRSKQPIVKELKHPGDSAGTRITRDFLNSTMIKFANLNSKIYASAGSYPFEYAERQIQSVLFCSFVDIGAFPYAEYPILRKIRGRPKRKGWLDLWVLYRNTMFLIEFKHTWASFNSTKLPRWINYAWNGAIKDVCAISKQTLNEERAYGNVKMFELVMLTIRLEQHPRKGNKPGIVDDIKARQRVMALYKSLKPRPVWVFYWCLNEKLQRRPHEWDGQFWNYPAICLLVWSKEVA